MEKRKRNESDQIKEGNINTLHSNSRKVVVTKIYTQKTSQIKKEENSLKPINYFENSPVKYLGHQHLKQFEIDATVERLNKNKKTKDEISVNRNAKVEPNCDEMTSYERKEMIKGTVKRLTEANTKYITESKRTGKPFYDQNGIFSTYAAQITPNL